MANTNRGEFVWHEHLTRDPKAAIAFYTETVGWTTQPFEENKDYVMWVGKQGPLGGVMKLEEEAAKRGTPPHWMGDVQVADVDATVEKVKKLGGKVYHEPTDIPTVGRFAVISDPQGAVLAIFTPKGEMTAHDSSKEGEFSWNELMTTDSTAAFKFYSEIFGWKIVEEMDMGPMGTYRVFGVGEKQVGGMMNFPKGTTMPPSWTYYAETQDLDAAIARATKKGAKVVNGPMEVPGGGRIVKLTDPQGAMFALHQATRKA